MSSRREYDLAWLRVGDRLIVAMNGRDPERMRKRLTRALADYRRDHDPDYAATISTSALPGFVVLERIERGNRTGMMRDKAITAFETARRSPMLREGDHQAKRQLRATALRLQKRAA
jgi:hypothetical protein